jgi:predicted nucleic acid-binding protein
MVAPSRAFRSRTFPRKRTPSCGGGLTVLRRSERAGALDARRAALAVLDLRDLPLDRAPHLPLVRRCWELRGTVTAYDAAYVALAQTLGVPLLTADRRLAAAPGLSCVVEVLAGG